MSLSIDINKNFFIQNIENIIAISGCQVCPVVKSNAYGHGLSEIIHILLDPTIDIERICVAYTYEANLCLSLGWKKQILIMSDTTNFILHPQFEYFLLSDHMLDMIIEKNITREQITIHIKGNIAFNRFGFSLQELSLLMKKIIKHPWIRIIGFGTQLPNVDYIINTELENQINIFSKMADYIELESAKKILYKHIFNSKGINLIKPYNISCNMIRAGGACYGLLTTEQQKKLQFHFSYCQLKQIMTLKTTVLAKNKIAHNEYIGYGTISKTAQETCYLIVDCGYGYGFYLSYLPQHPIAFCHNHYLSLCAGIAMNNVFLKISSTLYEQINIGDSVILSSWNTPYLLAADLSIVFMQSRPYLYTTALQSNIQRNIITS